MSYDKTTLQRIALAQEDPTQFFDHLQEIRDTLDEDAPLQFQQCKLTLELDGHDIINAVEEVREVVEDDG